MPRFHTAKWVHDPAACRRSLKARGILSGAYSHVFETAAGPEMDQASFDALTVISAAMNRVVAGENAAHRAASRINDAIGKRVNLCRGDFTYHDVLVPDARRIIKLGWKIAGWELCPTCVGLLRKK